MKNVRNALLLCFVIGFLITGCAQSNNGLEDTQIVPSPTTSVQREDPTQTVSPPAAVLLAGSESDSAYLGEVLSQMEQISQENGLVFERREMLAIDSAPGNLRLVVVLPPMDNLQALAAGFPETQFVAINFTGVSSAPNLKAIETNFNPDFQAFIAGYIAAVEADDWRVGLISIGDESGRQYRNAFLAGAVYFCGLCKPYYLPFYEYPLSVEVPVGASFDVTQQAANDLIAQGVNTLYVAPRAQSDELFRYLADQNLRLIGTEAPPAGLEGNWIASVVSTGEIDLRAVILGALNGGPEVEVESSLIISFTGLSEARLDHYRQILGMLENGVIDPQGGTIE